MITPPSEKIAKLRQEILLMQGFKPAEHSVHEVLKGPIAKAFPNGCFTTGAVHEFISKGPEEHSATCGFTGILAGQMMQREGVGLWVGMTPIFPPALHALGVVPDKMLFIRVHKEKHLAAATEEALKCEGVRVVLSEMMDMSFTQSRRFQLATEQTNVTALLIRNHKKISATACVSRWRISPIACETNGLPGVGHIRWKIELQKVRNGKPGTWLAENRFGELRVSEFDNQAIRQLDNWEKNLKMKII